jgi:hypothetical protein
MKMECHQHGLADKMEYVGTALIGEMRVKSHQNNLSRDGLLKF